MKLWLYALRFHIALYGSFLSIDGGNLLDSSLRAADSLVDRRLPVKGGPGSGLWLVGLIHAVGDGGWQSLAMGPGLWSHVGASRVVR